MFGKILLFEVQNRIRRPAMYLYFAAALVFTIFAFSTGSLPIGEKEHLNSPFVITMWCAGITMLMMLVSSSVMGVSIYRDIEFNTKDYYLTYPITKAGYFWGRYVGSFVCMIFISMAIIAGAFIGSKLGPVMGWKDPQEYGPNKLVFYLFPFVTIALPNIFFTSSLFFGLVALTRNVKVIYSGGIFLFLGYFLSIFFFSHTSNLTVINIADPFGLTGVRLGASNANSFQKNNTLFPIEGYFLMNRILWPGIGLVVLLYSYFRFSFEKFFAGRRDRSAIDDISPKEKRPVPAKVQVSFQGPYNRSTLFNLTKIELLNIIRDNYFWIIVGSGMCFLGFVFWMGNADFGVPDYPRTVVLFDIFNDVFPFFIFFVIMFYTGETLHRDRTTRYALINDSLPPPNWVLNGSKLLSLLILGFALTFIPAFLALAVQTAKGFFHYNFPIYFTYIFLIILPRLLEMVLFSYLVHVLVNNKFVAHAVGITFWVALFFLRNTGVFDYNLLLYSYTPGFGVSDMDGLGHMTAPVAWFNLYWSIVAGLFAVAAALFYYRGVSSSFKERLQLVHERFDARTKMFTGALVIAFIGVGGFVYYNVSYLNNYLTKSEREHRSITYEKTLKHYQSLPLPKVTRIKLFTELYPSKQQAYTNALVTISNKTASSIYTLLIDGDELTEISLKTDGKPLSYTNPLFYSKGMFNWFRSATEPSEYRLYTLQKPLAPGDSAVLEMTTSLVFNGFQNGLYAQAMLRNGIFFNGGLPGLGYDDDEEVESPYVRRKNGLSPKKNEEIPQTDSVGIATLRSGKVIDLLSFEATVGTSGDQTVIAPGELTKQWKQGGRNYFHFVQNEPGLYYPIGILSSRFDVLHDSIRLDHNVGVNIYHFPDHNANIGRFDSAYKDGLKYFSSVYGNYPFSNMSLAETSILGPRNASMSSLATYAEYHAWNADFTSPEQFDYCYYNTVLALAQQWWRFQVAPNNTAGSLVIPEGLATYSALVMEEKKRGPANMKGILQDQLWFYLFIRRRMENKEHPLIRADQWYEWGGKAGVALYGLRDLIGEDSMNAALRDFKNAYAFKSHPPFAGSNDLYFYLQQHTPDSLKYYLTDTWQKITLYDNKIVEAKSTPTDRPNEYEVSLTFNVAKVWIDEKGNDIPAENMNDYIDIGVFAANTVNTKGVTEVQTLSLKKYAFTAGLHTIVVTVKGKPIRVGIDPFAKLIDRLPNDNMKDL